LVRNGWVLLLVLDAEQGSANFYTNDGWQTQPIALPS
jgi:hypothetical protein